jgi:hypothetical protein
MVLYGTLLYHPKQPKTGKSSDFLLAKINIYKFKTTKIGKKTKN